VVDPERLVLEYVRTFVPTVAICAQGTADVLRSILNPVSFEELSAQVRLIWLEETTEAVRLVGAEISEEAAA